MHQSLSTPVLNVLSGAQGIYIEDLNGKKYIDMHGNGVHNAGFNNPAVIEAADHSFEVLVRSGRRREEVWREILERIETELRAPAVQAALRLSVVHMVLALSRLNGYPGRVAQVHISGGHVRPSGSRHWRERNAWAVFEVGRFRGNVNDNLVTIRGRARVLAVVHVGFSHLAECIGTTGGDRLRFLNPVPVGSSVHARSRVVDVTEKSTGVLLKQEIAVHVVGDDKPALVYESLGLLLG